MQYCKRVYNICMYVCILWIGSVLANRAPTTPTRCTFNIKLTEELPLMPVFCLCSTAQCYMQHLPQTEYISKYITCTIYIYGYIYLYIYMLSRNLANLLRHFYSKPHKQAFDCKHQQLTRWLCRLTLATCHFSACVIQSLCIANFFMPLHIFLGLFALLWTLYSCFRWRWFLCVLCLLYNTLSFLLFVCFYSYTFYCTFSTTFSANFFSLWISIFFLFCKMELLLLKNVHFFCRKFHLK